MKQAYAYEYEDLNGGHEIFRAENDAAAKEYATESVGDYAHPGSPWRLYRWEGDDLPPDDSRNIGSLKCHHEAEEWERDSWEKIYETEAVGVEG